MTRSLARLCAALLAGLVVGLPSPGCGACDDTAQTAEQRLAEAREDALEGAALARQGAEEGAALARQGAEEGAALARQGVELALSDDPDVVDAPQKAPPPPARTGNRARLLTNGEASYLERLRLIDEARRSIFLQTLIFKADTAGFAIADRLIARKRRDPDLDIRVIVDAYANIQDYDAQMLYFELVDAGIEVHGYEPLYLEWIDEIDLEDWTAGNKRYHEKYFVVDGERAVVGGMNIANEYARIGDEPMRIWRDQDIYLEGPVARDVAAAFEENFRHFSRLHDRRPGLLESDGYWEAWRRVHPRLRESVSRSLGRGRSWLRNDTAPFDAGALRRARVDSPLREDVRVRFIRSRPRLGERWIDEAYRRRIDAARRTIVIENAYFIPPPDLLASLLAAARRGVEVTIVTNSKETNDIPLINDAGRVCYAALLEAGARVYEWHAHRHDEGTLHAKLAVFDSEVAIIGSYNLDPRSFALNSEDVVVVEDARVARELHARVIETDLRLTERVTPEQAAAWSDPQLVPHVAEVPATPWWDPRFDADRFELFLIEQAGRHL